MTDDSKDALRAASFEPRAATQSTQEAIDRPRPIGTWVALAIGAVLLGFVVFILPQLAPTPDTQSSAVTSTIAQDTQTASATSANALKENTSERSPFAEAQLAKVRRSAQEVLQSLLETQSRLESRGVDHWAADDFLSASAVALEGDALYRAQDFEAAEALYQQALDSLNELEARLSDEINSRLALLLDAIESGDEATAGAIAPLLSQMAPDSDAVFDAVERVPLMPAITELETAAKASFEQGQLSTAVSQVDEALGLDPAHQRLANVARQYKSALTQQRFEDAMTKGFALLSDNDFTGARASFQLARNILPAADGPRAALAQLEEAETLSRLNDLLSQAADLAAKEQWAKAVEVLETALTIDPSLVEASDGLDQARPLAELFAKLDTIVEKQARLVDPVVLSEAQLSLSEAEAALAANAQTSPVLKDKVAAVRSAVAMASTPLPVVITSDGLTEITIKRVARLGTVSSRTVSLRPGQYQFLGSRDGYRDVLVTVSINATSDNRIDVRCEEAIIR
jgi:tetratricopeptide (TPR) repeat protein